MLADPQMLKAHVQPIVDLKRGVVAGYELLARFDHPLGGSPADWFAAAGELGYVAELDALVVRAASRMLPALPPNTFLSVNVTGAGVTSPLVRAAVRECAPLEALVVEITEQTEIDDPELLGVVAAELREHGAMIAIDDAGAGYANLQRILTVRPEFIKLDRSLVADLHRDEAKAAATEMMGALANRIDSWIVAEGVERLAELDRLLALGVPLAQGYLFARPGPDFVEVDASWTSRAPALDCADRLEGLIEAVRPALEAAEMQELGWRFTDDDSLDHLPVTDGRGRPVRLLERDTGLARPDPERRRQRHPQGPAAARDDPPAQRPADAADLLRRGRALSRADPGRAPGRGARLSWPQTVTIFSCTWATSSGGTVSMPCSRLACSATCSSSCCSLSALNLASQPGTTAPQENCFIDSSPR